MSGLDKIKGQILDDATRQANEKIAQAEADARQIVEKAKEEAEEKAQVLTAKADQAAHDYQERILSSVQMLHKKALLQAKQEVIAEVLDLAYKKVLNLEDAAYFDLIEQMLAKYVQPGKGIVYFNEKDLKRLPSGFEKKIQSAAENKGGTLVLSDQTKEMDGGFVLTYGGIEENCTIRAVFAAKKDELSDKVHEMLF